MTSPVVVSRIQNRRGTFSQFTNLYPIGYNGVGGFSGFLTPTVPINGASGTGTIATIVVPSLPPGIFPGCTITIVGMNPADYNGNFTVTGTTGTSISFTSSAHDLFVSGGTVTVPYNLTNYPNVLAPGELALCTDSRQVFIGNLNGEYLLVNSGGGGGGGLNLTPLVLSLPPVGTPTVIPSLTYLGTPFFSLLYDLTDASGVDWNTVGTNFSRNGQLQVTVITSANTATLTDVATEINNYAPDEISFTASYNGSSVEILYVSNLPTLTFSTTALQWLPF